MNINELTHQEAVDSVFDSMGMYPALDGRITKSQATTIVAKLKLLAASKRDPIVVVVGGIYRNAIDEVVTIVSMNETDTLFLGSDTRCYDANGHWDGWHRSAGVYHSPGDLIEVISTSQKVEQQPLPDHFDEIVAAVAQAIGEMTAFPGRVRGTHTSTLDQFMLYTYISDDWEDLRKRAAEVAVRKTLNLL